MKKIILLFIIIASMVSCADEDNNIDITEEKTTEEFKNLVINAKKDTNGNLVGVADKKMFSDDDVFGKWFNKNYTNYTPDEEKLTALKSALKDVNIRAYMGTWCPDSKRETPKLYKILDAIEYTYLDMIGVDRNKKANGLEEGYDVKYVATFILYRNKKEIGRFVEKPTKGSLEEDLLQIATGKEYKPYR